MPNTTTNTVNSSNINHHNKAPSLEKKFGFLAEKVNDVVGSPYWFVFSLMIIIVWIPSGLILGFGEIWHLLINTTTTILTFLMMSLLHASQSEWERKMERLQQYERSSIKELATGTAQISKDVKSVSKVVKQTVVENGVREEYPKKEAVSSIN